MSKPEVEKARTIESVVKDGLCTGCGTCAGLCPLSAIDMVINESKGIYVPRLDEVTCNRCGFCFEVCPGHAVDFRQLNQDIFGKQPEDIRLGNFLNCYVGHATDYDIRYNSASGGLVTALLIFALEQGIIDGALVTRMREDKPLEPQPFIARTREEIISAAKSKYCPVPANIALKEILKAKDGERFAVVGLPCHIHGIRKAEAINKKLKERIVLHIGLVCSNSNNLHLTEFILWRYGIKKESVAHLDYRGEGWPGYMTIYFTNGTRKLIPYHEYIKFHAFGLFTPRRCTICYDTTSELADISCGDAWGFPELAQDKVGRSLATARNEMAEALLQKATLAEKIVLETIDHRQAYAGNKRANLEAKFFLNRLMRKSIPTYQIELGRPKFTAYPYYLVLFTNMYVSSKKYLWRIIEPMSGFEKVILKPLVKPSF